MPAGSTISFYGDRTTDGTSSKYVMINCSAECYVYGNVITIHETKTLVLPATTLADDCYESMFYGCSELSSITCLATNISATNCTLNWVYGVAATGTSRRLYKLTIN